jgi:hypothetical protein
MAFCPKCSSEMSAAEAACPLCGYDFAPASVSQPLGGAYAPWTNWCLLVGVIASGIGCVVAFVAALRALASGALIAGLVVLPLACIYQIALMIVFIRARDSQPESHR